MFMRRVLEISIFCFYWIVLGLISFQYVYHDWLVKKLKLTTLIGEFPALFLYLFILLIIYIIIRRIELILYAKCKLSEKRLLANLKRECRSLESGINGNVDIENSTESLLSKPSLGNRTKSTNNLLSDKIGTRKYGKSMEDLATGKMSPLIKQAKSLENILEPVGTANRVARSKIGNTNYGNSVENLAGNSKSENAIYEDLTESLKHAILKSSKSMDTVDGRNVDAADACVEDLLKIYENFCEIQNTIERNKKPLRKAPPAPIHMKPILHKEIIASNANKNLSKGNIKLKTVNEKSQVKKLW